MRQGELPELGQIVEVVRGRDRGICCVVVAQQPDRYVWIADGHKRKAERPKKKNVLHLRKVPHVAREVRDAFQRTGKVTNAELRYALRSLAEGTQSGTNEEGGRQGGER